MKFFLDENLPTPLGPALATVHFSHEFVSAHDRSDLLGVADVELFKRLRDEGFDAIVTKDANQTANVEERRALYDCGLVWLGHQMKPHPGLQGISLTVATIVAGLFYALDDWPVEPWVFRLKGLGAETGQRISGTRTWLEKWT